MGLGSRAADMGDTLIMGDTRPLLGVWPHNAGYAPITVELPMVGVYPIPQVAGYTPIMGV